MRNLNTKSTFLPKNRFIVKIECWSFRRINHARRDTRLPRHTSDLSSFILGGHDSHQGMTIQKEKEKDRETLFPSGLFLSVTLLCLG
jgi:hypothetical protein